MAHAIVHRSCTKLRSAIRDEAIMRRKFTGDLEEILTALEEIQPDLEEAERQSWWRAAVRNWLMQVRKASYDIWDMVDELQQETSSAAGKMTRMRRRLSVVPKKKNSTMAIKLKDLKLKLKTLQEESLGFDFRRLDASVPDRLDERDTAPQIDEAKVFGRDGDKERIMLVLSESDFSEGPIILPIDGLEGMGKTTLAAMVFNDTRFEGYSRVWIHVSQEFDLHKIGKSIISQVSEEQINHDSNEMRYITERLHELLSSRKVLIVLHDLWHEDSRELQSLKRMLSAADKGSQVIVIVTVRDERIASEVCTIQPYRLRPLSDDMCWAIIKQTSCFADRSQSDIEKLEQIGWRIAGKCEGLPSAAKEIGRMLKLQDGRRWEEMSRLQSQLFAADESFYFDSTSMDSLDSTSPVELLDSTLRVEPLDSTSTVEFLEPLLAEPSEALPMSFREFFSNHHIYINMPPYLRLCCAYCAIFSEDAIFSVGQKIVKDDLIHQWIALDLIEPSDRFSARQLGEQYFKTLLRMSLLGTEKRNLTGEMYDKGEDMFTLKYALNDFLSYIIGDELIVLDGSGETSRQKEHCRYAVIGSYYPSRLPLTLPAQLRALDVCSDMNLHDVSFAFNSFLRVLELKQCSIQKLPDSLYKLRQLRYLNLSGCSRLVTLLETFGDLINLVHMDLSSCSGLVKLPQSLGNLIKLVHMDISGCSRLVELPRSFGKLINLEHINFSGCRALTNLAESLGDLINLSHVNLSGCSQLENLLELFENLKNLVYLDLSFWSCLKGILVLGGLTNLQYLNLSHPCCYVAEHSYHLEELPAALGKLTELQYLNLSMFLNPIFYYKSEYQGREYIKSCISGLYNLKHLDLSHNIFLSEIPESIGDLSKLHTLDLSGCARLKIEAKWLDENKPLKLYSGGVARGLKFTSLWLAPMMELIEAAVFSRKRKKEVATLLSWVMLIANNSR